MLENTELKQLEKLMEEMAGAPREEYHTRQPGEKGKYETWKDKI